MRSRRAFLRYVLPTAAGGAIVVLVGNPVPVARGMFRLLAASTGEPYRRTITCMGTFVSITVYDEPGNHLHEVVERAFDELRNVDRLMSVFRHDSDLSRVNRAAGNGTVVVAPAVCEVLETAIRLGHDSAGRFDVTVLPLLRLFGLRDGAPGASAATSSTASTATSSTAPTTASSEAARRHGRPGLPAPEDLQRALALVDYRCVHVDRENREVGLELAGAEIDLGGIAKGYAVDRAVQVLREHGIENAVLDAGGDLYAMGAPANGDGWPIGIQDPLRPDHIADTVILRDQAIATSGSYEHFVTLNGDRYGHLFDPASGTPVSPVASASVVAPTTLQADALSTTAYLMGLEEGARLVAAEKRTAAVFLTADDNGGIEVHGTGRRSAEP